MPELAGRKVAMIIAHKNFRDPELTIPKNILENNGAKVVIASTSCEPSIGVEGTVMPVDILIDNLKVANFDAVVFIGGPGAIEYFDNKKARQIAKETFGIGKIIAAICAASGTLAKSGVLTGKRATSFSGVSNILNENGAIFTGEAVTIDGNIITANGPAAATQFGEALVQALTV